MWLRISIASVFVWKGILKWINVGCRFHITAWTLIPSPPLSESSSSSEKKPQPDTKHRLLTVLLDALLNRVSVKHCSCAAPRWERCFNKARVNGGFPLELHILKIYVCSWYRQALWMKASIKRPTSEDDCTPEHCSTIRKRSRLSCILLFLILRVVMTYCDVSSRS